MFAFSILHLSLHKWCQEKNTCTGKTAKIESQNTFCVRASGVFNSFTVKKVNFFTINVKFKVILSSKSGGGGIHPPHPPGIYASDTVHALFLYFSNVFLSITLYLNSKRKWKFHASLKSIVMNKTLQGKQSAVSKNKYEHAHSDLMM